MTSRFPTLFASTALVLGLALACGGDEADAPAADAPGPDAPAPEASPDPPPAPEPDPSGPAGGDESAPPSPPDAGAAPGPADAPDPSPVAEEPPPEPAADEEEAARIEAGIRSRKIRALDILLVDAKRTGRTSHARAEKYCSKRQVEGVGGWRLPTVGEIASLTQNGIVRRDLYWSLTKGDTFGDKMLVWNARRQRIRPMSSRWRGARVACVRTRDGRPPEDSDVQVQIDD